MVNIVNSAARDPDAVAVTSLNRRGKETRSLRRGALLGQSWYFAVNELAKGSGPVVLALEDAADFAVAFVGAMWVGRPVVPVPVPDTPVAKSRCETVLQTLGAVDVIARDQDQSFWAELQIGGLVSGPQAMDRWPLPDEKVVLDAADRPAQDIALIQFSSGSTQAPKAICVSREALDVNLGMIERAFDIASGDIGVGWLPLHHDMGLVGFLLEPLWAAIPTIIMPPSAFLMRPSRWLAALSDYGATITGGASFGYEISAKPRRGGPCRDYDLSRLRIAFCGAEPVNMRALDAFADRFAPVGFDRSAFLPCYGLAEAVLMVTCAPLRQPVETCQGETPNVLCGASVDPRDMSIFNSDDLPAASGEVGEIAITGPGLASGLWKDGNVVPFGPDLWITSQGRRFLRTGDLGFLCNGQLAVTGRRDAMIPLRGRNLQAEEIERMAMTAANEDDIGKIAVAQAAPFEPVLWVMVEIQTAARNRGRDIARDVAAFVTGQFGVSTRPVVLTRGAIPVTSSGKIARHKILPLLLTHTHHQIEEHMQ